MFVPSVPTVAVSCPLLSIRALQVVKPVLQTQPGSRGWMLTQGEGGQLGTYQATMCYVAQPAHKAYSRVSLCEPSGEDVILGVRGLA